MWSWKPRGEIHKKSQSDNNVYAIYTTNAYCEKVKCIVAPRACIDSDTRYACERQFKTLMHLYGAFDYSRQTRQTLVVKTH